MQSKKKNSSPTVWHYSLDKSRSNLHQESWEKQNYVCALPSWKTYIRNPSLFFISFSPSHLEGNNDGNHDPRTHICAWGGEFCQVSIFAKLVCQTVGGQFFLFCQNYMDAKLVCQTVGVLMSSKKKSSSPIVWHNPLAKSKSNLHQEPWERNKIIFIPFHLLTTLIRNSEKKQNYFYTLPPLLIREDAPWIAARIYTRGQSVFPNLG
jgi:hypothetical protein